jgi:HSP20 family protein
MNVLSDWRHGLGHAWQSLTEGWNELRERATGALTRFKPEKENAESPSAQDELPIGGSWGFLAADLFDDDDKVVVRLEAPGLRKQDFGIELQGDQLVVRGEKRFQRETSHGQYRLTQCAYGNFRRVVVLPAQVLADKAVASYRDGVLRIELPKSEPSRTRRIPVNSG